MKIELFQIGPLTIYSYGLMIALGVIAAFALGMYQARAKGWSADTMFDLGLVGIIGGIVGAKLLYYITELPSILKDPSILWDLSNGFVVYGGLIAGILSPYVYARIKKIPFWPYMEMAVASIPLAQGFGRIGCFLAGCCYGRETDLPIGVVFPENSLAVPGVKLIPTQLISSAGDFLIALVLVLYARKKQRNRGAVTGLYLVLYSVGRFFIEFLRADYRGWVGPLSTSQFISIFILLIGIGLLLGSKKLGPWGEAPKAENQKVREELKEATKE